MERWLPVIDYAVNNQVSISTLRRRIKSQKLEHRLENGRYLIKSALEGRSLMEDENRTHQESLFILQNLISDLKKAYGLILAEKEELIKHLKDEIETLRHVNQFLESQIIHGNQEFHSRSNEYEGPNVRD